MTSDFDGAQKNVKAVEKKMLFQKRFNLFVKRQD